MEKKNITLSVALATYNEEANIGRCLASVAGWADEIVVVDGGSTDTTISIARSYKANVIHADNPAIFHINKQKALDRCSGKWILQLDADEVVTEELKNEINGTINNKQETINGYYIPRKNCFLGHWLRKGGQYPDYLVRFFQRGKGTFPCKSVHEQIKIDGKIGHLRGHLLHYTSRTMSEYWRKAQVYTLLTAQKMKEDRVPATIITYLQYNTIKPVLTFFLLFVRHKGFVDGIYGFLFALFSALHHPIAYQKYIKIYNA